MRDRIVPIPCRSSTLGVKSLEALPAAARAYITRLEELVGAPIDIIVPDEGVGWDMEATAIIAGTDKLEAAQTLVDWSISKEANVMYNTGYAVVAYPGVAKPVKHFPPNLLEKMIDNDFEFAANNRKRILAEWQKRYDSKSEPKS